MKVGTDGTMLGCWANVSTSNQILDVGCGSGVLTAICAQKNSNANIIGIDVENGAFLDATENVSKLDGSWSSRITILQTCLQDFVPNVKLDHIVSNPPFFENSQVSVDDARNFARHTDSLHYRDILSFGSNNLVKGGKISLVLPYENGLEAINQATLEGYFLTRKCVVFPIPQKAPHRLLLEFSNSEEEMELSQLIIETGIKRHDYTDEYKALGKDFYLYF
ncbi:MAG: methyltransferase [Flavobacteriales bacterium]|nr:methyltransferase [Flavobacteriales bacterium]